MSTLGVIIASTRPGRAGRPVGRWAAQTATSHGGFRVEVADLAELALPMMDEPHHPRLGEYVHEHTRRWSRLVNAADAFVFVTPSTTTVRPQACSTRSLTSTGSGCTNRSGSSATAVPRAACAGSRHSSPSCRDSMVPLSDAVAITHIRRQIVDDAFTPSAATPGGGRRDARRAPPLDRSPARPARRRHSSAIRLTEPTRDPSLHEPCDAPDLLREWSKRSVV